MKKLFTTVFLLTYFIVFSQTLSPQNKIAKRPNKFAFKIS